MIKSGSTQDIYAKTKSRQRHPRRQNATRSESPTSSSSRILEPPKSICLDDLRALLPEPTATLRESTATARTSSGGLESPKSISIEELQELLTPGNLLDSPPEIDLDDLRDLLEPAGVLTRRELEFKTRDLLAPGEEQTTISKFRAWQTVVQPAPAKSSTFSTSRSTQSFDIPSWDELKARSKQLKHSKTRSLDDLGSKCDETVKEKIKVKLVKKQEDADVKLDGPEAFLKKLEELAEGDNLEKWIAGLDLPKEFDLPKIREQIRTFLKEKSWEKGGSVKFDMMDGTLTKKLWAWFKDLSIAKQIMVVIGLSIVIAAVGFLTMYLLSLIWPVMLGVGTSGEAALVEIAVEGSKIRQEPAFHLLQLHAEQAKPMSHAWANQFFLWKYCRT